LGKKYEKENREKRGKCEGKLEKTKGKLKLKINAKGTK
jgi:hypothetical protein